MSDDKHFLQMLRAMRKHTRITLASSGVAIVALLALVVTLLTEPQRIRRAVVAYKQRKAQEAAALDKADAGTPVLRLPEASVIAAPPELPMPDIELPEVAFSMAFQTVSLYAVTGGPPPHHRMAESGFLVERGLVMATAHVLYDLPAPERAEVHVQCNAKDVVGKIEHLDFDRDILIVRARGCGGSRMHFRHTPPDVNEDGLTVAGFDYAEGIEKPLPYQRRTSIVPGAALPVDSSINKPFVNHLLKAMRRVGAEPLVGLSGECNLGHSGSVILDGFGAVVGMMTVLQPSHGRSFMIPAVTMKEALAEHKRRKRSKERTRP
jgi:hypothetical protein